MLPNKSNRMLYWSLFAFTVNAQRLKHSSSSCSSLFLCTHVSHNSQVSSVPFAQLTLNDQIANYLPPLLIVLLVIVRFFFSSPSPTRCVLDKIALLTNQYLLMWQLGHHENISDSQSLPLSLIYPLQDSGIDAVRHLHIKMRSRFSRNSNEICWTWFLLSFIFFSV